ncbi:MAG TPA: hypothetical protein VNE63_03830 [Candidatus Acidoferrales bacterium]|nr:hypothetical protein [Candidatus Acidoferrales bacterium]
MISTSAATREGASAQPAIQASTQTTEHRATQSVPASDDEILGIASTAKKRARDTRGDAQAEPDMGTGDRAGDSSHANGAGDESAYENAMQDANAEPENLRELFDANPELRRAWQDAQAYRDAFASPEEARAATAQLADIDRMDALFFSRRPEDHAQLARAIADLDPVAFGSLAKAIAEVAQARPETGSPQTQSQTQTQPQPQQTSQDRNAREFTGSAGFTPAQAEFFHATNAAAVQGVLDSIETQVERLLPEGASKNARNRVVGEIYRELDGTLRENRQLTQQVREAFRSGTLDAEHQRAIVSLITGRARQALPGVAKRVLNEWTSTVMAANQDRRERQRAAERRVDIAGSHGAGSDGRRSMTPRDIDYARMSDADILNL